MNDAWLNHLTLVIFPWLVGGSVGVIVAYLLALAVQQYQLQAHRRLFMLSTLFPWRTVVVAGIVVVLNSFPLWYGLFMSTGLLMMAIFIFLLVLPFSLLTFLEQPPVPTLARLVAILRTAIVAAMALAIVVSAYTAVAGIYSLIQPGTEQRIGTLLVFTILMAGVDVLLGLAQVTLASRLPGHWPVKRQ